MAQEQRSHDKLTMETMKALIGVLFWLASSCIILSALTGCSDLKYVECLARDNTRNPCN